MGVVACVNFQKGGNPLLKALTQAQRALLITISYFGFASYMFLGRSAMQGWLRIDLFPRNQTVVFRVGYFVICLLFLKTNELDIGARRRK